MEKNIDPMKTVFNNTFLILLLTDSPLRKTLKTSLDFDNIGIASGDILLTMPASRYRPVKLLAAENRDSSREKNNSTCTNR